MGGLGVTRHIPTPCHTLHMNRREKGAGWGDGLQCVESHVQGARVGYGVRGAGCGVWGVGCGVWGMGCRVLSVGCGVQGVGCEGAAPILEEHRHDGLEHVEPCLHPAISVRRGHTPTPPRQHYSGVTLNVARPDMNNYATLGVMLY